MAKAPKPSEAFRALGKKPPSWLELTDTALKGKSDEDRTRILMDAARLDDLLENAIVERLRPLPPKVKHALFSDEYAITTFSMKCNLAYGLGLIGDWALNDLEKIRLIRNGFAHFNAVLTFDTAEVTGLCSEMILPDKTRLGDLMFVTADQGMIDLHHKNARVRWWVSNLALVNMLSVPILTNNFQIPEPSSVWDIKARAEGSAKSATNRS